MQVSAEVRWFLEGGTPPHAKLWFERSNVSSFGFGGRPDEYVRNVSAELGIKKRGSKPGVEIKTLISRSATALPMELWVKTSWDSFSLSGVETVTIDKKRRLRKFAYANGRVSELAMKEGTEDAADGSRPAIGCNLELTTITVAGKEWTTIGAESFAGPDDAIDTLRDALTKTLDEVRIGDEPWFAGWQMKSYPSWLVLFATK